jgi:hypothetical protein
MAEPGASGGESVLVDFFYAPQVGHGIEALHHALAIHRADPTREVAVLLNAATPMELADCCPFVATAFPVRASFVEPAADADSSLERIPPRWDWVLDDPRRHQDLQLELFAGMRDHYAASDRRFVARQARHPLGYEPPTRARHEHLRLELPAAARSVAAAAVGAIDGPIIALMPAGSSGRSHYPSLGSWQSILDALADARPDVRVLLVGRLQRDERSSTALGRGELEALLEHRLVVGHVFDRPLLEQLAFVERCTLFLAPHTGFGMAALATATPWLALSGGRWFEWYFNRVPFRSVIPDTRRYPCFSQMRADVAYPDGDDGDRIPSMSRARIADDLPRIVAAARELLDTTVSYERCLDEYVADLVAAHGGDVSALWSFDDIHRDHLPARPAPDRRLHGA